MKKIILILPALFLLAALSGCSAEKYGMGVDKKTPLLKVKDVYLGPEYMGKTVSLEGKISSQCGSNGCWFVLQDDTGQIFINLAPANLTLPPRMGMKAKVTGTVYLVQNELQVFAQGVEIR